MDIQGTKAWRFVLAVSIICLIFIVLAELFFLDWLAQRVSVQTMEYFTLLFTFVLMADIYFSFLKAADNPSLGHDIPRPFLPQA